MRQFCCTLCGLAILHPTVGLPQPNPSGAAAEHDGQHDFDFEIGTSNTHLKNWSIRWPPGQRPLDRVRRHFRDSEIWDGRAQIEQFETEGALRHIEGLTLRLYNPQTHQWRLYWANAKSGYLDQPMAGEFKDEVGEFYDQEPFNGRMIYVRYIWSRTNTPSPHFEQSHSDDDGETSEGNRITDQTRVPENSPR